MAEKKKKGKKTGLTYDVWKGEGEVLLGDAELFGAPYEIIAVRVQDEEVPDCPGETIQAAVDDPNGYLQDLEGFMQSQRLETVTIPGYPGDWVLWLTPQSCEEDEGED